MAVLGKRESNFEKTYPEDHIKVPQANYQAAIFGVFDRGLISKKKYKSEDYEDVEVLTIGFEINKKDTKGNNLYLFKDCKVKNYCINIKGTESGIYKIITAIFGHTKDDEISKGIFDTNDLIGKNCLIFVKQEVNDDFSIKFSYVENVNPLMEGMKEFVPTYRNMVPLFSYKGKPQ